MAKERKTAKERKVHNFDSFPCSPDSRHFPRGLGIWQSLQYQRDDEECITKQFYVRSDKLQNDVNFKQEIIQKFVKELGENLAKNYSHISTYEGVFGGEPHLEGHRFAVTDVLASLIVHNSFDGVMLAYKGTYSEEQLKQAVRYALYFIKNSYCPENECE